MADLKSSNTDTIVKIFLVFFISLLSFSIGTFVGKKFSDNQHKLSTMEPTKGADEKTAIATGATEHATQEETLSDDQVAALANEFVDDESQSANKVEHGEANSHETAKAKNEANSHNTEKNREETDSGHMESSSHSEPKTAKAEKHAPPSHAPAAVDAEPAQETAKHEPVKGKTETKQTARSEEVKQPTHADKADKVDRADKEEKTEELAKIPSNVAKEKAATGTSKFTIQIASYPSESEAQKKADELKKLNFEAFYTPATIKGQTWFRVNVGTYATSKEAQEHKTELIEKIHSTSAIIQQLVQ
jgi:septal ring-binding cell division protein DamX